jgi:glycosyltransferase involved in cell wall biosynthesis
MENKRILFLCAEEFEPKYEFLEKVFGKYLPQSGYEFTWIMPDRNVNTISEVSWSGGKVYRFPKRKPNSIYGLLKEYLKRYNDIHKAIRKAVKKGGSFDAIQVRDDPLMAYIAAAYKKENNVPFVYQLSHLKEEEQLMYASKGYYGSRIKNIVMGLTGLLLRNWYMKSAQLILPISKQMSKTLERCYNINNSVQELPEGVDGTVSLQDAQRKAKSVRKKYNINKNSIIYLGTINKFREPTFIIDVVQRLKEHTPQFELVILGSGRNDDDVQDLLQYAENIGVREKIKFLGYVDKEEVYPVLCACTVGISPFPPNFVLVNNSPIKTMEYMLTGLPVVASNIPENNALINGANCGRVVEHESSSFADAIAEILGMPKKKRTKIGKNGRRFVLENRSFRQHAEDLIPIYDALFRKH